MMQLLNYEASRKKSMATRKFCQINEQFKFYLCQRINSNKSLGS